MGRSGIVVFMALWRAYGEGRLERCFGLIDAGCDLITLDRDEPYRGHDGIQEWLGEARRFRSLTVTFEQVREPHDGCVVAAGRVVAGSADGARAFDRPFGCVAEFRDGRLIHGRAFADHAGAVRFAAGRRSRSGSGSAGS
jgi:hypothetical protein